jgi:hypothetical protein
MVENSKFLQVLVLVGSLYLLGFGWTLGILGGKESFGDAIYDSLTWPIFWHGFIEYILE